MGQLRILDDTDVRRLLDGAAALRLAAEAFRDHGLKQSFLSAPSSLVVKGPPATGFRLLALPMLTHNGHSSLVRLRHQPTYNLARKGEGNFFISFDPPVVESHALRCARASSRSSSDIMKALKW